MAVTGCRRARPRGDERRRDAGRCARAHEADRHRRDNHRGQAGQGRPGGPRGRRGVHGSAQPGRLPRDGRGGRKCLRRRDGIRADRAPAGDRPGQRRLGGGLARGRAVAGWRPRPAGPGDSAGRDEAEPRVCGPQTSTGTRPWTRTTGSCCATPRPRAASSSASTPAGRAGWSRRWRLTAPPLPRSWAGCWTRERQAGRPFALRRSRLPGPRIAPGRLS